MPTIIWALTFLFTTEASANFFAQDCHYNLSRAVAKCEGKVTGLLLEKSSGPALCPAFHELGLKDLEEARLSSRIRGGHFIVLSAAGEADWGSISASNCTDLMTVTLNDPMTLLSEVKLGSPTTCSWWGRWGYKRDVKSKIFFDVGTTEVSLSTTTFHFFDGLASCLAGKNI